ncbi:MAG: ribosome biogenesis GTP-binding protein YihA/YsxC [Pseudomonadales bacterium]|jgi:GTP-binding protein|nr:ribosome biogenesis GTP-binding protein YihA/YsxC [Pseudomonadales bacterium]
MQQFDYQSAGFLTSATRLKECPADEGQEVAFCGRSNAGKSSAINALTRQKKLARTSKTPGRTQLINFFALGEQCRLVDLPGYGYAKVPISLKQYWQTHLDEYFRGRKSLKGIVLVADIRHALKPFDEMMVTWSQSASLPIHILLTKSDKLKRGPQQSILLRLKRDLPDHASVQTFSSNSGEGIDALKSTLDRWFANP